MKVETKRVVTEVTFTGEEVAVLSNIFELARVRLANARQVRGGEPRSPATAAAMLGLLPGEGDDCCRLASDFFKATEVSE